MKHALNESPGCVESIRIRIRSISSTFHGEIYVLTSMTFSMDFSRPGRRRPATSKIKETLIFSQIFRFSSKIMIFQTSISPRKVDEIDQIRILIDSTHSGLSFGACFIEIPPVFAELQLFENHQKSLNF